MLEEVDDYLCCYCRATGRTHLLDAFPAELLRLLSTATLTESELAQAIAEQVDEPAAQWQEQVVAVLDELRDLRLVEPAAS